MQEVTARTAVPEDAGAISLLNLTSLGLRYAADKTKARLEAILQNPAHAVFVAAEGARVVGYLHIFLNEPTFSPAIAEAVCLAVHSDSRGHGVGRLLMRAGEAWARQKGAAAVRLTSSAERQKAHAFYKAIGYAHTRDCKEFYRSFETEAPA